MNLTIDNLRFRYEDMEMVFNFEVCSQEFMAILGPSGAGKSTLLSLIGGFEMPISGSIKADGIEITKMIPSQRPVTSLFQEHNLFAHLSVFDNVSLGINPSLRLNEQDKGKIQSALASVGLVGLEDRLPGQLSGGERQRAALARCLVRQKPVLLLDEPFTALGPALRQEMIELVLELKQRYRLTILMVTHDPWDAKQFTDRTAFIANGKVILVEETSKVLDSDISIIRHYLGQKRS